MGSDERQVIDSHRGGEGGHAPPAPPADAPVPTPAAGSGGRLISLTDGREYPLTGQPFRLGRDPGLAVVLTSPDASRQHAEVVTGPAGDVLVDLSSSGTFVNGARVRGRHALKALDVIRIGAEEFRYYPALRTADATPPAGAQFRLGDTLVGLPRPAAMPPRPVPPIPGVLASFLVRRGQRKGDRIDVVTPAASLGRGDANTVNLPDPSVSSRHATLRLRDGVWILSDLGSTNGTAVDGEPVRTEVPLSPGSILRLGEVDLLFEPRDPGRQAPAGVAGGTATAGAGSGARPGTGAWGTAAPTGARRRVGWMVAGSLLLLTALLVWALLF